MSATRRIGVLISGRGSNLAALIAAQQQGRLGGEIVVVASNVAGAAGLQRAREAGIRAEACEARGRARAEHEAELTHILKSENVDLVCLAGFMRRLTPTFVQAWAGRLLNVHPSLLPAFPGLNAQRGAWEHGVKISGATVHLVDERLDEGAIVAQEAVPVLESDGPDELAARILQAEHRIYPEAVRRICQEGFSLVGRRVVLGGTS
jgi:phosphoribosylglycinamide formyltransferase-1